MFYNGLVDMVKGIFKVVIFALCLHASAVVAATTTDQGRITKIWSQPANSGYLLFQLDNMENAINDRNCRLGWYAAVDKNFIKLVKFAHTNSSIVTVKSDNCSSNTWWSDFQLPHGADGVHWARNITVE